jgi:hypothetical protein
MSLGNLKDNGNKGNNFPYQYKVLQLLSAINGGISSLPGSDYETRTTTYEAIATVVGQYTIGDILVRYDVIDVPLGTVATTIWFNQTTQTTISAPASANIQPYVAASATATAFSNLVRDTAGDLWIELRIYDTVANSWIGSPTYYAVGDNTSATPTGAVTYIDYQSEWTTANGLLTSIWTNTGSVRTPQLISSVNSSGTIGVATLNISFYNSGSGTGSITVSGGAAVVIPVGATINYDAGGNGNRFNAGVFAYNTSGTTFIIAYTQA